jgi:hypothetical protein
VLEILQPVDQTFATLLLLLLLLLLLQLFSLVFLGGFILRGFSLLFAPNSLCFRPANLRFFGLVFCRLAQALQLKDTPVLKRGTRKKEKKQLRKKHQKNKSSVSNQCSEQDSLRSIYPNPSFLFNLTIKLYFQNEGTSQRNTPLPANEILGRTIKF